MDRTYVRPTIVFPQCQNCGTIFMDIKYADVQTRKISHYANVVKVFMVLALEPVTLSTQQPAILGM